MRASRTTRRRFVLHVLLWGLFGSGIQFPIHWLISLYWHQAAGIPVPAMVTVPSVYDASIPSLHAIGRDLGWPSVPVKVVDLRVLGLRQQAAYLTSSAETIDVESPSFERLSCGLPCLALSGLSYNVSNPRSGAILTKRRGMILLPWRVRGAVIRLPVALLMPGFGINIVFYALIGHFACVAIKRARHRRRRRFGLCINCGYALASSHSLGRCSECGNMSR
jgi:hypothetical protein